MRRSICRWAFRYRKGSPTGRRSTSGGQTVPSRPADPVCEKRSALEITSTKMLLVRCWGLSLSDQYWICPEGSDLAWGQYQLFENDFSDDIGDVLFGG